MVDIPIAVIGGRGPHGLALHLWMQDRGLTGYRLIDPAPHWLALYGPEGPMQAVEHLRSPRELDFSLSRPERAMGAYCEDGNYPLAGVYSLDDAQDPAFNSATTPAQRAERLTFWRYANAIAQASGADRYVIQAAVTGLRPMAAGWQLELSTGEQLTSAVVLLATGLMPHLHIPQPWRLWWQQLPPARRHHALALDYRALELEGKRVAVLGSSNTASWEAALALARRGASVTLLSRHPHAVERQLPFSPYWFCQDFMRRFMQLPAKVRLRQLKHVHVPASALPGTAASAKAAGVRVIYEARVRYAAPLWGRVQLHYQTPSGLQAMQVDHLVAATGATPRIRDLPLLRVAAQQAKAPVVVSGPARHRPILDDVGRWKNLPPLYPLGAFALARAGLAAATLASAVVYLPLVLPDILQDAGLKDARELALQAA